MNTLVKTGNAYEEFIVEDVKALENTMNSEISRVHLVSVELDNYQVSKKSMVEF